MFDDISPNTSSDKSTVEPPKVQENMQEKLKVEVKKEEVEDTYDLQKELEAKFDELFGPLDD